MKYVTGLHALNISCGLDTAGDWHTFSMDWDAPEIRESRFSAFGDYGIEANKQLPNNSGFYSVANHIRALLDLIEQGRFFEAAGMRDDFICNDGYTADVFDKIFLLRGESDWENIDRFMGKEYKMAWLRYKESKRDESRQKAG